MDFRLTDGVCDPEGTTEAFHSEQLVRMPRVFSCYQPQQLAPEVASSPSLTKGVVTFGSFNNRLKLNQRVLDTWARILLAVKDARLLLKDKTFNAEIARHHVLAIFSRAGIESSRITLLPQDKEKSDHLARYAEVDIALDPFPYCGTTTTCEALWQGVPVISLAGSDHRPRVGLSQLTALGLESLASSTEQEYVELAVALAADKDRHQTLRAEMRERFQQSPLMDHSGFTRELESVYRDLWQKWCDRQLTG